MRFRKMWRWDANPFLDRFSSRQWTSNLGRDETEARPARRASVFLCASLLSQLFSDSRHFLLG